MEDNTRYEIWSIYNDFMSKFDFHEKFMEGTINQLRRFYGETVDISYFLNIGKGITSYEDLIASSIFLLYLGIELNKKKNINSSETLIKETFSLSAKFLDLILKYDKDNLTINQKKEFLLLSAISYDLTNKIANSIVQSKKIKHLRENGEFPIDILAQFDYYLNCALEYLFGRKLRDCKEYCKIMLKMKNYFDELMENEKKNENSNAQFVAYKFLSYLEISSGLNAIVDYILTGKSEFYISAKNYISKSINYFIKTSEDFYTLISDLLILFLKKEKKRILCNFLNMKIPIIRNYVKILQNSGIYEFWPSQIEGLKKGLLSKDNFLICAPTSAGKTLMAELAIVHTLSSNPESSCFYIVPTKALANQIAQTLEKRLTFLKFNISKLVGGQNEEIDNLILQNSHICVCTPEKFYQLHKKSHILFQKCALIIIDEAHLIGTSLRGLDLEFEITRLLRKYYNKRIILISAVVKNFNDLITWINSRKNYVFTEWKPTRTINTYFSLDGNLIFFNDLEGLKIPISTIKKSDSLYLKASKLAYLYYNRLGMTLIFSDKRERAETIAKTIYEEFPFKEIKDKDKRMKIDYVCNIIRRIISEEYDLIKYLKKGIAFHHGSLPNEVREGIEQLIQDGIIKIIASTTTLAEGINTPVSCLIIPYLKLYDRLKMKRDFISMRLFKNLTGRVGRALISTEGYVILIESDSIHQQKIKDYIYSDIENLEKLESFLLFLIEKEEFKSKLKMRDFEFEKNYPKALFQNNLLSILLDLKISSEKIENFIDSTYFNLLYKEKTITYQKARDLIKETLSTMEYLPIPVISHSSPYHITKFGKLCYETGLSPITMNNFYFELRNLKKYFKTENFLDNEHKKDEFLKEWFGIFRHAIEIKNARLNRLPLNNEEIPQILLD